MMLFEISERLRAELGDGYNPFLAERLADEMDDLTFERYGEGLTGRALVEFRLLRSMPRLRRPPHHEAYANWVAWNVPHHEPIDRQVFEEVIAEALAEVRGAEPD